MGKAVVVLEDLDFVWRENEVTEVVAMWRSGIPIDLIASNFGRDIDEVGLLVMHLRRQGIIRKRKGGAYGRVLDDQ